MFGFNKEPILIITDKRFKRFKHIINLDAFADELELFEVNSTADKMLSDFRSTHCINHKEADSSDIAMFYIVNRLMFRKNVNDKYLTYFILCLLALVKDKKDTLATEIGTDKKVKIESFDQLFGDTSILDMALATKEPISIKGF